MHENYFRKKPHFLNFLFKFLNEKFFLILNKFFFFKIKNLQTKFCVKLWLIIVKLEIYFRFYLNYIVLSK